VFVIGKTISHYKILEKLGEGGMGVVYKAEDTKLKRFVALKFLPPELTRDPEAKQRFIHEARAASALEHTNICNIHEIDEIPIENRDQTFIVMACYEGEILKDKIQRGPLKIEEAIDITMQIGRGLDKAHKKGIVHRDIKPANVLITDDDVVKIVDFGLAKLTGRTKLTKTGSTLGTVAYMSPEQTSGEKVDHRSDIWSLGVVLYEMVTGQLPFKGDYEQAVVYSIVNEEPKPVTGLRTGVPVELEKIVNKCLEKDSALRYQHADDLIADLYRLKRDTSKVSDKPSPERKKAEMVTNEVIPKKRKIILPFVALFVIIALATVFYLFILKKESPLSEKRVAVAIFENQTGDPALDHIGRIAAEHITQGLGRTQLVLVMPVTPVDTEDQTVHGMDLVNRLAKVNHADIVVSGVFYKEGENLRFHAQITDVSDGIILQSLDISEPFGDPMIPIETLRQRVIGAFALLFEPGLGAYIETEMIPTYIAYREYIEATVIFLRGNMDGAIERYNRALTLDPTFLRPLSWIAVAHSNMDRFAQADSVREIMSHSLDKMTLQERGTYNWLDATLKGDLIGVLEAARKRMEDYPNITWYYVVGVQARATNKLYEAIESFAKVNPAESDFSRYWAANWSQPSQTYHMLGQYDRELALARRGREWLPDRRSLLDNEIRALAALGRTDELGEIIKEGLTISGGVHGNSIRLAAQVLRAHGHIESAGKLVEQAIAWYRSRPDQEVPELRDDIYDALYCSVIWDEGQLDSRTDVDREEGEIRFGSVREERIDMLKQLAQELTSENPEDIESQGRLGTLAVRLGNNDEALRVFQWLGHQDRKYMYGRNIAWQAKIATILGEYDRAVTLFQDAFIHGYGYRVDYHYNPDLEELRKYPPFQEFLRPKD